MTTSATHHLAKFISGTKSLPHEVSERAKFHVADTISCIYAGTSSEPARKLTIALFGKEDPNLTVPDWRCVSDSSRAALLIGTCAHGDDLDDTSEFGMKGHPSASVVSALLPTARDTQADGLAFIRSYVVGVEVACKLGSALGFAHVQKGWHTMSTLGTLGGAAACANLRGLNPAQTETALAIACSFAGGILGNTGTDVKGLHCGLAARDGYTAAVLAESGFTAGHDILDAQSGFLDAFTDGSLSKIELPPLGRPWEIIEPGLSVKLYPSCNCTHSAIEGALEIRRAPVFEIAKIAEIKCYVRRKKYTEFLRFPEPETGIQGKFSMNYTVAVALLYGDVRFEDFLDEAVRRDDVINLGRKVTMICTEGDEAVSDAPDIEVIFYDGSRISERRTAPLGTSGNPVGWDDISMKFEKCIAQASVRPVDIGRLINSLQNLEKRQNLIDIFADCD